jgi:poly-gamma-glutamate synthesis protein (capsule biosynthesis protein)
MARTALAPNLPGPPEGAGALARARIDVVSTADNPMGDHGRGAFLETLAHLDRAGVGHVGGGRSERETFAPLVIDRDGFRVAWLAVTDIWNQGDLSEHAARHHVAAARPNALAASIRAARAAPGVDAVLVSYHGGGEYIEAPMPRTRWIARVAIDAGADAFLGHHPHVVQGVELRRGRPIFYSLGNLLMRANPAQPDTALGAMARLRLRRGAPPASELCPVRAEGIETVPLARDPRRAETEAAFLDRLRRVRAHVPSAPEIGEFAADGCAPLIQDAPIDAGDRARRHPAPGTRTPGTSE